MSDYLIVIDIAADNAKAAATLRLHGVPGDESTAARWLDTHITYAGDRVSVLASERCRDIATNIAQRAILAQQNASMNSNTVAESSMASGENFLRAVQSIAEHGHVDAIKALRGSCEGRTVFVVGAGPSLDQNIADLATHHRGPVFAVNTSCGALTRAGITPTATIVLEASNVTDGLSRGMPHAPRTLATTAHPTSFTPPSMVFASAEPSLSGYHSALGITPLFAGSSCTTFAVAVALAAGARRVALIGQDCAFAPDGRMYAAGTPYESVTAVFDHEGRYTLHKKGTDTTGYVVEVPAIGGGFCKSTLPMASFAHWFEALPKEVASKIVNCTSSGAHLRGIPSARIIDTAESHPHRCYDMHEASALERTIAAQQVLDTIAEQIDAARLAKPHHATRIAPIISRWTAGELVEMRRSRVTQAQYRERMARAVEAALDSIEGILE